MIGTAIGGREAGLVFEGDRRFPIVVRLPDAVRADIEALRNLPVPLPRRRAGRRARDDAACASIAALTFTEGPNQISRENGKRRVVVTANVRGRDIGSVVAEAQAKIARAGAAAARLLARLGRPVRESDRGAAAPDDRGARPASSLIFLLLFAALGSARDALLVFSAVPLALTGGIVALWLRGMPFSISAAVGFIALSGVAVLNGLVMLTFIRQLIARGPAAAARRSSRAR